LDSDEELVLYEELTQVYVEDYYELVQKWTLTRRAQETLEALRKCPFLRSDKGKLWTYEELYQTLREWGHSRAKFGDNSLRSDLTNLWRCGKIWKFAKGMYQRTNRPYGIHWLLHIE
jgi:hypothetical protein